MKSVLFGFDVGGYQWRSDCLMSWRCFMKPTHNQIKSACLGKGTKMTLKRYRVSNNPGRRLRRPLVAGCSHRWCSTPAEDSESVFYHLDFYF